MRLVAAILAAAFALRAFAVDPALAMLANPSTDPSRMMLGLKGADSINILTSWLEGGEQAFTAVSWVRIPPIQGTYLTTFGTFWSVEPGRATREGGDELPATREHSPLSLAGGTAGGSFDNPHYECPADMQGQWGNGCYCVNITTDSALTLVLGGTERQVAASNGVMQAFNIQASAADFSWSVATSPSANVSFGFGVNPLVHFYGLQAQPDRFGVFGGEAVNGELVMPIMTNEWIMCATRVRIESGTTFERMGAFSWTEEWFPESETTNAVTRTTFARNARVAMTLMLPVEHSASGRVEIFGRKVFRRWLSDDELRNVRDLDMFEMQRRGMTRWVED